MTAVKDFIVAIELGSSKITGIAGKKNSDGSIQVLAYAREEASAFIRKGIIYNINKTALGLTSIVNKLEEQLDASIAKVYVGIGGQSLHSRKNFIVERMDTETIITSDIVNQLIKSNQQTHYQDLDILDVVPQEYKVKNNNLIDPIGVVGNQIEGHFLNIVARSSIKRNILTCFEQAEIEIAGFFISPIVLADSVLTDVEKRSGCALVDFGSDTTTVAIYKNSILRHLAVIPLGSNNITKDICTLQIEETDAENLKIKYGSAYSLPEENTDDDKYPINETRNIQAKLLNDIVGARTEEIIANIRNQIMLSGYQDKLSSGVIITGGGANLKNLQEAFIQKYKFAKVRIANFVLCTIKATEPEILMRNGRLNTLFSLLAAGKENCCQPEKTKISTDLIEQMEQAEKDAAEREAEERERRNKEAAAAAVAAEEEERKRKELEMAKAKANDNALKTVKANLETVEAAVAKVNEALKNVKTAQANKDSKSADKANIAALAGLKEAQTVKEKTALTMNSITDEAFLSEARVAFNTIEAMVDEAEQTREEVTRIKDEVKRENSLFGKWRKLTEDIMKD